MNGHVPATCPSGQGVGLPKVITDGAERLVRVDRDEEGLFGGVPLALMLVPAGTGWGRWPASAGLN